MRKYTDLVLDYKNKFGSIQETVVNTDKDFSKYFKVQESDSEVKFFSSGLIYSFYYKTNSKINKKRSFINRNPIVLCTDFFKTHDNLTVLKGIDIITVPPSKRIQIISKIFDNFSNRIDENLKKSINGIKPSSIFLNDETLERILYGTGYTSSMFSFKVPSMRNIKILPLDDWYKLPYLKLSSIEGSTIEGIYREYESKLK